MTPAASNGHLTEVLHFMGKEEGAPERLRNKAETPGTPADGGPAHLLPHNYGGEMARQGQRKIRALLCGEGAEACTAYRALDATQPSTRLPRAEVIWIDLGAPRIYFIQYPLTLTLVSLLSYDTPEKKNTAL